MASSATSTEPLESWHHQPPQLSHLFSACIFASTQPFHFQAHSSTYFAFGHWQGHPQKPSKLPAHLLWCSGSREKGVSDHLTHVSWRSQISPVNCLWSLHQDFTLMCSCLWTLHVHSHPALDLVMICTTSS